MSPEKLIADIREIIEQGQRQAYAAVGQIAVMTYWNIGCRIVEEEQHGAARAQYGTRLIKTIAEQLSTEFGRTTASGGYGIIDSSTCVLMICRFGTRECQISHGLISAALWQCPALMPEGGMQRKPHGKCGASVR